MKKNIKLLSFFLALLLLMPSLFSCVEFGISNSTTLQETGITSENPNTYPASDIDIVINKTTEYNIVYPAGFPTAARLLKEAIADQTSSFISINSDLTTAEKEKEIIVGNCDRPKVQALFSELSGRDYIITYQDGKIFIIGGNDEATIEAVEYFIENYMGGDEPKVTIKDNLNYRYSFNYFLGNISIDGIALKNYSIVYPQNGSIYEKYAAENLAADIFKNTGNTLIITDDKTTEKQYEFLVGNTNRTVSHTNVTLGKEQFVLFKTGDKIVMNGDSYMVGGAVGDFLNTYMSKAQGSDLNITNLPTVPAAKTFVFKEAKNAILMIGDGMGFNHVELALEVSLEHFFAKDLPNKGSSTTNSLTAGYTDSAAAGTALATGYKTYNSYLGMDRNGSNVLSLRELVFGKGGKTAILTTDALTGATPAAYLVHHKNRNDTAVIQNQINVVTKNNAVTYAKGNVDNALIDETKICLSTISEANDFFFAMIEGAYIDKHAHKNDVEKTVMAVTRFNDSIAYAMMFVLCNPDTVLIITADHETGGIVKNSVTGKYEFTVTTHTTTPVPVYAMGYGTEFFNNKEVDNIDIAKFIAKIYTNDHFGQ